MKADEPAGELARADRTTTARERARGFRILFLCLLATGVGNSMLFAVLPPLAREMSLSDFSVSIIYTTSALLFTISSQIWGGVSDRVGRKPVILIGLVGYAISMALMSEVIAHGRAGAMAPGVLIFALAFARGIFGAVGSASNPSAQAYVADRTGSRERIGAISNLTAAFGVGAVLGPAIAAAVAPSLGLVAPLLMSAGFALFMAGLVLWLLPERTRPRDEAAAPRRASFRLALDPRIRVTLIVGCIVWTTQSTGLQTLNFFIMDRLGVAGAAATRATGVALGAAAIAMMISQLGLIPSLRLSPRAAMIGGAAIGCVGAALMMFAQGFVAIVAAWALMGLGMGLSRPGMAAATSLSVDPDEQGGAAGLAAATAGIGFLAAPFVGMSLYVGVGPTAPFVMATAALAAAATLAAVSPSIARASARADD